MWFGLAVAGEGGYIPRSTRERRRHVRALSPGHGQTERRGDGGRTAVRRGSAAAGRLLAGRQLPVGGADLPARKPAPARAAAGRARQAAPARPLRHHARAEPDLRAPEPGDHPARARGHLRHRAGPRRAGAGRKRLPRGHLQRGLPAHRRATRRACRRSSASSRSPAGSRATSPPRRPARSTRAASSATPSRTRSARPSTTPAWWSPAWSATARPRPGRSRPAGTATSS